MSVRMVITGTGTLAGLVLAFAYPTSHWPASGGILARRSTSAVATGSGAGTADGTFTGQAVDTAAGRIQVEVTLRGGTIASARAVQVPEGNQRHQEISDYAVPILNREAVQAGSAHIDAVSGATITSDGYIRSLQSALDQAHR